MKYVSYLNELFRREISKLDKFVLYGQNVSSGSCLGGLARDFKEIKNCTVINTPNTENALVGMGFGLMLGGVSSAFFMKQQDFLLLGVDHLRNTNNFIRQNSPSHSFTIVNIVMDGGYEGIQSSLNNLSDFCAISSCDGYTISSKQEAISVIEDAFIKPGFRIISVSQRLFGTEILDLMGSDSERVGSVLKYKHGSDITIACFNFSLPQGVKLCMQLNQRLIRPSLFCVTAAHPVSYISIIEDAKITGRLVIIDDSKSYPSTSSILEIEALRAGIHLIYIAKRKITEDLYRPTSEIFDVDLDDLLQGVEIFD